MIVRHVSIRNGKLKCVFFGLNVLILILGLTNGSFGDPGKSRPLQQTAAVSKTGSGGNLPASINYGALAPGTLVYAWAVAQSDVLTKAGLKTIAQPTTGPSVLPGLVGAKEIDIANNNANTLYWAYKGKVDFEGKPHKFVRILQAGTVARYGIVTRADTGIKTIKDLKGKKVTGNYPTSPFLIALFDAALKAYGVNKKDITIRKGEIWTDGLNDLNDRKVDAAVVTLEGAKYLELASSLGKPVVIPIDPEKLPIIQETLPPAQSVVTPDQGVVQGGIPVIGVPNVLWAHENMSDDTAYFIVRTLIENYDNLQSYHKEFKDWSLSYAVRKVWMPYHPGAIRYYKEKGVWSKEMDDYQRELLRQK